MSITCFDATGILRWGAQSPTGIQRVEQDIYLYCRQNSKINIVVYDDLFKEYVIISNYFMRYLDYIVDGKWNLNKKNIFMSFRYINAQMFYQSNETARRLASAITGGSDRGAVKYKLVKTFIRIVGFIYSILLKFIRILEKYIKLIVNNTREQQKNQKRKILVSHDMARKGNLISVLKKSNLDPVYLVHDIIPLRNPELVSRRFARTMHDFINRILHESAPIIVVSDAVAKDVMLWNSTVVKADYKKKIKVCPLGVTSVAHGTHMSPIPSLEGKNFVLYCSTMETRKRHDTLIDAWGCLLAEMSSYHVPDLVFIGRDGSGKEAIKEALCRQPSVASKLHILHQIDDAGLRWAYANAQFGVFSSSAEGWGLGVSECLAFGLPVVHSQLPSLIEASQNLMPSAPVGAVNEWVDAIRPLITQPEVLLSLRKTISENFFSGSVGGFAEAIMLSVEEF
jgi:glycosyltransferase involved in cell wall biosynthesis